MRPATINLDGDREIYQGDDYQVDVYIYQADGVTLQNLTGYTAFKSQVRDAPAATQVRADFTCTAGNQTTNPGLVTLTLTSVDTTGMQPTTNSVWDLEMVNPAGKKQTWVAGSVTVIAQVTR